MHKPEKTSYSYTIYLHIYMCCAGRALRLSLPANFTCDPSFHLDDIRRTGESEASQDSLPALQLVHLQDGPGFFQLSLGCSDVSCDLKNTHM